MSRKKQTPLVKERADAGWSLLELLVALALMSTIVTVLLAAISSGQRALSTLHQESADATIFMVQQHLRQALSSMQPARQSDGRFGLPLINASASSLTIVSSYVPPGQRGGLYQVKFKSEDGGNGTKTLVTERTIFRPVETNSNATALRPSMATTLLPRIAAVRFLYYGRFANQSERVWHDDWSDVESLPDLVSVDVVFPDNDPRQWPKLIVEVPVGR